MVARILGSVGIGPAVPPAAAATQAVDTQPVASVKLAADQSVAPRIVVSVPMPRLRPTVTAAAVAVIPPAPVLPTPTVGTFVKKKFLWPDEGVVDATGAPPG
jgi:hypothetical protein